MDKRNFQHVEKVDGKIPISSSRSRNIKQNENETERWIEKNCLELGLMQD